MKKETIHLIKMLSKRTLYGFIVQCLFYGLIMADPGSAQSIKDIYVSVDLKNATIKEAFNAIEKETKFRFSYARKHLNNDIKITSEFDEESLEFVLKELSKVADLKFKRINDNIVVENRAAMEKAIEEVAFNPPPQPVNVSGTVLAGNDNTPLPGVSIIVKGTTTGTTTDLDGNFRMDASPQDILVFSYIGYITQEMEVGSRTTFNITLAEDLEQLEEVIVVGYGTQEKRDVTAAINSVGSREISELPVASAAQAMQGRMPGVDVTPQGGRPGAAPSIRIRGRRSINASNEPLFVVDGIPLADGINSINQNDIQSIEVLKDAAATAIYGSRGANGVILITTKRGKAGKTQITYDGYYGVTNITKKVDMMNGSQFAAMKRESRRGLPEGAASWDGTIPSDDVVFEDPTELESIALGRSTNYQDLIFSQGSQTNHQLSISGGSEKTTFNISLGYFQENGIIETQDYTRYTTRINLDHKITDRIRIGTSTLLTREVQNFGTNNVIGEAIQNNPLGNPYNPDGSLKFLPIVDGIRTNPLNELVENAILDERAFNRIFSSIYATVDIVDGLTYRMNFGPDIRTRRRGLFEASLTNRRRGADPRARTENRETFAYTLENILNYDKSFGDHTIGATFLQSIQTEREEEASVQVVGLPYESQLFYNLGSTGDIENYDSYLEEWQLASFMGRLNYSFKNKYLLQLTVRTDGSSRLADGNKWSTFPGISAGWRIIDEPFMDNVGFFDELKLRASWGIVGNTSIDPYQTAGRLAQSQYVFGNTPALGFRLNEIPNPALGWERTSQVNAGVDFGILNGRISGTIDYYVANTTDLLLEQQLPFTSGYENVLQNIGQTRTRGIELVLSTVNFDSPSGFRWTTDINWGRNQEEIVELFNGAVDDVGSGWFIGEPLRVFYDYQKIGIWQANEASAAADFDNSNPGEIKVADLDGDGVAGPGDRTIIGTDVPSWTGGMTNRFEYKGFDLSFFFFARWGHTIQSRFHDSANSLFARYNNLNVDYWTPDNPTNSNPRPNLNQERPRYVSTLRYFDGSFIKLRNINFGYNLPQTITDKLKVGSLRVYGSVQNPWFYSRFDAFDPEVEYNDRDPQIGVNDVPLSAVYLMGLNIKF